MHESCQYKRNGDVIMKKTFCALLAIILLLGVTACASNDPPDESIKDAPEYIASVFNKMNELAKENKFTFKAWGYIDDKYTGDSFVLAYTGKDAKGIPDFSLKFQHDPAQGMAITGIFQDDEVQRPAFLKDIITALMMTVKPSLSLENARTETETFMNSRPTKTSDTRYSERIQLGEYTMWMEAIAGGNNHDRLQESLNLRKTDQMFFDAPEKREDYAVLSKDTVQEAVTSSREKYQITGKVNDFKLSSWGDYSSCEVEDSNGQKVTVIYNYGFYPVNFEIGKTYTFFGESIFYMDVLNFVEDRDIRIPCIRLTYAE